jgi:hypothetical protein
MSGPERWRLLHSHKFISPVQTAMWFYQKWLPLTPTSCCSDVIKYLELTPVRFDSEEIFFKSSIDFHNSISDKLGNVVLSHSDANLIWRHTSPQRLNRNASVVSSISPQRIDRQIACINSWIMSGFDVTLMQTPNEIIQYSSLFNTCSDLPIDFIPISTPRPLIKDMVKYGMILNSDCMMLGYGPSSIPINSFYLRWNYKIDHPSQEEEWGLDCCYVDPQIIPNDFPFMIGEPFWDYAVPAILINNQIPFKINHLPWLHHLTHPLNWSQADWHKGHNWVTSRFQGDYSSPAYRQSLDPSYTYKSGMWIIK